MNRMWLLEAINEYGHLRADEGMVLAKHGSESIEYREVQSRADAKWAEIRKEVENPLVGKK